MSNLLVCLDEAKEKFGWQDLIDLLDQFVREAEKLETIIVEQEESNKQLVLLLDISNKKVKELQQRVEFLEGV